MSLTQLNSNRDYDLINRLEDSLASLQVIMNLLEANSGPIVILHTLKLEVRRTYTMLKQMKQKRRPITIDSTLLMDWS
jgi:DNA polymerase III delta subunit